MEKDQKPWKGKNEETEPRWERTEGLQFSPAPEPPSGPVLWEPGAHSLHPNSSPAGTLSAASWQCFPSPSPKGKAELQGQRAGKGKASSSCGTNKNWSNLNWVTCQVCLLQMHSLSLYDRCPHSQSVSAELISPEIPPLTKTQGCLQLIDVWMPDPDLASPSVRYGEQSCTTASLGGHCLFQASEVTHWHNRAVTAQGAATGIQIQSLIPRYFINYHQVSSLQQHRYYFLV